MFPPSPEVGLNARENGSHKGKCLFTNFFHHCMCIVEQAKVLSKAVNLRKPFTSSFIHNGKWRCGIIQCAGVRCAYITWRRWLSYNSHSPLAPALWKTGMKNQQLLAVYWPCHSRSDFWLIIFATVFCNAVTEEQRQKHKDRDTITNS